MKRAIVLLIALMLMSTIVVRQPQATKAATPSTTSTSSAVAPVTLEGTLSTGAPYRIRVPANWNGTLVVYSHGYRTHATHPGEVEDRTAHAAPGTDFLEGNFQEYEDYFLAQGYALAGSAYTRNGWVVAEGIRDTKAVTDFFRNNVANPQRTILWGFSMGSIIAMDSIERYPFTYDGAICGCTVGAGSLLIWDNALDVGIAYDSAFGWPASWGTSADVRDDIYFNAEVFPTLLSQISNPANFGKFEFIRLVNQIPLAGFYDGPLPYLFVVMSYITQARADLEKDLGGKMAQNHNHHYSLSASDKTYLASLGVNADSLLNTMNAKTNVYANPISRGKLYLSDYFLGFINRPVISIHNIGDQLVRVSNESVLTQVVSRVGKQANLQQVYTTTPGHCAFSKEQLSSTLTAMETWVKTGTRPNSSFYPAALGFNNNYTPPAWPQSTSQIGFDGY